MDNKKIIVALLLITIILAIASLAITFGLNKSEWGKNIIERENAGNVQLTIEENIQSQEVLNENN